MNRITAVVLFLLFAFGCAGQHTEQTTPTTETWQEEVTEEVAISETEEFVIDGESADMVVLRPALVTIHGANTVKEAEESAELIGGCYNLHRARFGDRNTWVCSH